MLGPLLFIIFLNDLPDYVVDAKVTLYADDTSILVSGRDKNELDICACSAEESIKAWFAANKLALNEDKTQRILFSLNPKIYSGDCIRLLGLTIDDSLRWTGHIDRLCNVLSQQIFGLRRLRDVVDRTVLLSTYHALFQSRVKYCVRFWGCSVHVEKVLKVQKRALRVMCCRDRRFSCRGLFRELNVLTVTAEYIMASVTEIHKARNQFSLNMDFHTYHTRHRNDIVIPSMRLEASKRNTLDVSLYNHIPLHIRRLPLAQFKNGVKQYLMRNVFYNCREFFSSAWPNEA